MGHIVEIVKPKKPDISRNVFALKKVWDFENYEEVTGCEDFYQL